MIENPSVARAREIVLTYGWNSTSFQIVNPGISRWFSNRGDAVVGYVPSAGVRVVAGAPVCSRERLKEVVDEFEVDAASAGEHVCYFCAEHRLEAAVNGSPSHSKFILGAQPVWQPQTWPEIIKTNKSLRAQLNRARNKGVTVTEWPTKKATGNQSSVQERQRRSRDLQAAFRGILAANSLPIAQARRSTAEMDRLWKPRRPQMPDRNR